MTCKIHAMVCPSKLFYILNISFVSWCNCLLFLYIWIILHINCINFNIKQLVVVAWSVTTFKSRLCLNLWLVQIPSVHILIYELFIRNKILKIYKKITVDLFSTFTCLHHHDESKNLYNDLKKWINLRFKRSAKIIWKNRYRIL